MSSRGRAGIKHVHAIGQTGGYRLKPSAGEEQRRARRRAHATKPKRTRSAVTRKEHTEFRRRHSSVLGRRARSWSNAIISCQVPRAVGRAHRSTDDAITQPLPAVNTCCRSIADINICNSSNSRRTNDMYTHCMRMSSHTYARLATYLSSDMSCDQHELQVEWNTATLHACCTAMSTA